MSDRPKLAASGPIPTPCVGICSTVFGDTVCRGCKRYAQEIIDWNAYGANQRQVVERRLNDLLVRVLVDKIRVTDPGLLAARLRDHGIRFSRYRDPVCWVLDLLRTLRNLIRSPRHWGFEVLGSWRGCTLTELYMQIDQEFYALSEAHYDYARLGDTMTGLGTTNPTK